MWKTLLHTVLPAAAVLDLIFQAKSGANEQVEAAVRVAGWDHHPKVEVRGDNWVIVPTRDDDGEDEIPA